MVVIKRRNEVIMKKERKKRVLACALAIGMTMASFQLSAVPVFADDTGVPAQGNTEETPGIGDPIPTETTEQPYVYPEGVTVDESGTAKISATAAAITASAITAESLKSSTDIKKFEVEEGNTSFLTTEDGAVLMNSTSTELIRYASGFHESGNYTLPETLTIIPDYGCESALDTTGFVIPASVESIGAYGFYQGGNLLRILFNEKEQESKLTSVGAYAFAGNTNLEISLPHSVTTLGEYCFANCANLKEQAQLTEEYTATAATAGILSRTSITEVPAYCFYGCTNLHYVDLPSTVKSIGDHAFSGCTNMDSVNFAEGTTLESLGTGIFEGNTNLHKIEIPEGVTTITADTFAGCQNLNNVKLPSTVTTIEDNAFSNCNNIHELNIPASVTYIAPSAFSNVTNLDGIDTSESTYASQILGKTEATNVTDSEDIGTSESTYTSDLLGETETQKATYLAKGKTFTSGKYKYKVTSSNAKGAKVMLVGYKNKKAKKKQKPRTLKVKNTVTYKKLSYTITSIKAGAFKNCKKIKKIVLYNQTTIGKKAFYGCKSVKSVYIYGKKLKKVGKKAFQKTNKKAKIYLTKASLVKKVKKKGIKKILIKK